MRLNRIIFSKVNLILFLGLLYLGGLFANKSPKISIITSIFKGEYFIAPFLLDITGQTIFNDCELILLDANLSKKSLEYHIIKYYLAKYPNQIIYKKLNHDPGLYAVWNLGINLARGDYITNANLDDRLAGDCYEIHAQILDQNPDIDLVYSNSYMTKLPNETFELNSAGSLIELPEFRPELIKKHNLPSFNPMWRKAVHVKHGYFDESLKIAGDWEFWVRLVVAGAKFKKAPGVHGLFYHNQKGLSLNKHKFNLQKQERNLVRQKYASFFN